jgi:hypothetical protein
MKNFTFCANFNSKAVPERVMDVRRVVLSESFSHPLCNDAILLRGKERERKRVDVRKFADICCALMMADAKSPLELRVSYWKRE